VAMGEYTYNCLALSLFSVGAEWRNAALLDLIIAQEEIDRVLSESVKVVIQDIALNSVDTILKVTLRCSLTKSSKVRL